MPPNSPGYETSTGQVEFATGPGWVAVQFHGAGPVYVVHEDGATTQRMTMPRGNNIAQLPLDGAA